MVPFLTVCIAGAFAAAPPTVKKIEINSYWGGLGPSRKTELVIEKGNDGYRLGRHQVEKNLVENLDVALREPVIATPTLENLGITHQWLEEALKGVPFPQGTPEQQSLFKEYFTDPSFVTALLPELFFCCHTDDYPGVTVTIRYEDGSTKTLSSHSQSSYMLPWKIQSETVTSETFDTNISKALIALLPTDATNRERLKGDGLSDKLADVVMKDIEDQWNLLGAESKDSRALSKIRTVYTVLSADVNPYHDVAFGVDWEGHKEHQYNLQVLVTKPSFPKGFYERAILRYYQGKTIGVEDFLRTASAYEDLALSVPWLTRLRTKYPKWSTTLLWVEDTSFSNKAMKIFAADMHAAGKDLLAEEVRHVQKQVAVLTVSYGDYWLVLPDRRMVLWRYESVSGLLGWKHFAANECSDYQGVTGGCVGAVVSPEGELIQE